MLDDGATVVIRWESATYRPANHVAATRDLLHGEAALVTAAILGPLPTVVRVRFTIVRGERVLASGETWRTRGLTLAYATHLGGGTYVESGPTVPPTGPGDGQTATGL